MILVYLCSGITVLIICQKYLCCTWNHIAHTKIESRESVYFAFINSHLYAKSYRIETQAQLNRESTYAHNRTNTYMYMYPPPLTQNSCLKQPYREQNRQRQISE